MENATDKQLDFIVSLANKITGRHERFVSQHKDFLGDRFGLSTGQISRMKKSQASTIISELKDEV